MATPGNTRWIARRHACRRSMHTARIRARISGGNPRRYRSSVRTRSFGRIARTKRLGHTHVTVITMSCRRKLCSSMLSTISGQSASAAHTSTAVCTCRSKIRRRVPGCVPVCWAALRKLRPASSDNRVRSACPVRRAHGAMSGSRSVNTFPHAVQRNRRGRTRR